jgi:hypothetical protein
MTSFRGQASSAQMMSLGGNLTALACHPTIKVNKAEELTLTTNIGIYMDIPFTSKDPVLSRVGI